MAAANDPKQPTPALCDPPPLRTRGGPPNPRVVRSPNDAHPPPLCEDPKLTLALQLRNQREKFSFWRHSPGKGLPTGVGGGGCRWEVLAFRHGPHAPPESHYPCVTSVLGPCFQRRTPAARVLPLLAPLGCGGVPCTRPSLVQWGLIRWGSGSVAQVRALCPPLRGSQYLRLLHCAVVPGGCSF